MPNTHVWIGNASAVAQIQTYKPGQQSPNTTITATVNGKAVSYLSVSGTNDDLIAGLITALNSSTAQELKEILWTAQVDVPAVASPNSKTLKMVSATPGVPFTVTISLTTPPTVTVARTTAGRRGVNEQQTVTIGPNGQSGAFTITWSGQTTGNIPLPPQPLAAATAAGSALVGGASAASIYKYAVSFVTALGETEPGSSTSLSVAQSTTANGSLSAIPTGPSGVTARRIYRTKVNGSTFYRLAEISDNTTTTYTDSTTDAGLLSTSPPPSNFAFEGAMMALSNIGAGNFKVGGVNLPAVPSTNPVNQVVPAAFAYVCEFVADLGNSSRALMTGDVAGVTVLPTITVTETQAGCPIQSAIQKVGWRQVLGQAAPAGNLTLTLPDLGVTTAPIAANATAVVVLAALQAASPPAYANSFAVAAADADAESGCTWNITYQGLLANKAVQQCQVNITGLSPASGDTLTPVQTETQPGSATGRDEMVLVTINNNPTGGLWYLSAVDPNNGNAVLMASTGIGPNPALSQVTSALGGTTVAAVSGPTGGPFEISLVGELGSKKLTVLWASNLTGGGAAAGSPPTTGGPYAVAPVQNATVPSASGGSLASATYYYKITDLAYIYLNGIQVYESVGSNEQSAVVTGPTGSVSLSWNASTPTSPGLQYGYKIYRGTAAGAENVLVGEVGAYTLTYLDTGGTAATLSIAETAAGAAAVNEVQTITLNGATGGSFALAVNGDETSSIAYNAAAASVQTALQALLGWTNITVTGSAGGPYTATYAGTLAGLPQPLLASLAAGLTGSSTANQSLTTVATSTGPNYWSNAANWSPAAVPAAGDSVVFQNSNVPCLYGLNQSAVTLLDLTIDMSYAGGKIGLPAWNGKYYEYRSQYLQVGVSGVVTIGNGKGSGPSLIKLDTGTVAANLLINNMGNSSDPALPSIIWKGNRVSGSTQINLNKGKLAIAPFIGETATVDVIRQNYISNKTSDTYLLVGGGVTITTWNKNGGDADCYASLTTLTQEDGTFSLYDNGNTPSTVTTLGLLGGTFYHSATGTITTLSVGTGAVYDRTEDSRPATIGTTKIYGKSSFIDPHGSVVFTTAYQLIGCGYPDLVKFDVGSSITGTRTKVSF